MSEEKIDHPKHYNSNPSGVEAITVIEHMPFNIGSAMKYLWRAGFKPGESELDDLRKAAWYVAREIARREKTSMEASDVSETSVAALDTPKTGAASGDLPSGTYWGVGVRTGGRERRGRFHLCKYDGEFWRGSTLCGTGIIMTSGPLLELPRVTTRPVCRGCQKKQGEGKS